MDSELSCGVDGAMFVLSHTLVHPRIHQGQAADLQTGAAHLHPVLRRFLDLDLDFFSAWIVSLNGGRDKWNSKSIEQNKKKMQGIFGPILGS